MSNQTEAVDSVSNGILHNLLTSIIQDIVARERVKVQVLETRYPNHPSYHIDNTGTLDIHGAPKRQESSQYFNCLNCGREISANRFAAHLQRCSNRGSRR
ncbi:SAGA histone acetyltransferase complex subunit SGF11 NDAI_0E03040 [Naumovozyma dairenensis CBS 421]|uniref:SAGA-associated factor 11 n=1 Tax=Naumovozyma dairenensis (strain ATCC 10597 / BCRC 20456 / CBS 421 / NBRC 0211 / NRRL Y-12639) TaxID=1071378 RepID=G0WBK1_NAUDC|nr:hypothetical protein NDAI_0E03040 [Naumovozyma dairenensis CBS 421]CCD25121.1 hypothetical protein NDAI_0E03040 [Naumovozyma dairenensis CBS 421]